LNVRGSNTFDFEFLTPALRTRRLEWRCLLAPLRFVGMLTA
jgi:hypothetical protein